MKVIATVHDTANTTGRSIRYFPTEEYELQEEINILKKRIISNPSTVEEAKNNKEVSEKVRILKNKQLNTRKTSY